jgi:hypothetical protein
MRSAKRRHGHERSVWRQEARHGVDACHFECLLTRKWRKDARQASGEHRLPRARRAREQQVVCAGSSDLERAAGTLLTAQVREVGTRRSLEYLVRERLECRHVDLAAEVRNHLGQVADWNGFDARECGLRSRLGGADHSAKPGPPSSLGHCKRANHRADSRVECKLTY